jgi:heme exporter protein D
MLWPVLQAQTRDPQLVGSAFWLWTAFACAAVLMVAGAWVIVSRQRRMVMRGDAKLKRKPIRDAWAEAGRRLEVEPGPEDPR